MKKLILLAIFPLLFSNLSAQDESTENDENAKYHEFDFWIGEWEIYRTGTKDILGFSKIESIVDSFGIQETYRSAKSKYIGTSINKYNLASGQWEQYWIDNTSLTLYLKGRKVDNQMILQNKIEMEDGSFLNNRITWTDNEDGTVRQVWEKSYDDGQSWSKIFDGLYKKKKSKKNKKSKK
jgi:hypothetical protein